MRRLCIILFLLIFSLSGCQRFESVDLTAVSFDGIYLGDMIDGIDLMRYTPSENFSPKKHTYYYDELHLTTDLDGCIVHLKGNLYEKSNMLSIDTEYDFTTIEDITVVLGDAYRKHWYDREQGLRANTYLDLENQLKISFIYSQWDRKLVWIEFKDR